MLKKIWDNLGIILFSLLCSSIPLGMSYLILTHKETPKTFPTGNKQVAIIKSCKDDDGVSCGYLRTRTIKSVFLFEVAFKRAYLEAEVVGKTKKFPTKLIVEHGLPNQKINNIPKGYKLISCFCSQEQCLIQSPTKSQLIGWDFEGNMTIEIAK